MSTYRQNACHKRRSDDESSDCDGDLPPVKKLRSSRRESTFALSILYLGQSWASRCRRAYNWLMDIPKKKYFRERMMANDVIVLDDERDDGKEKEPDIMEVINDEIDLCIQEDQENIPRGVTCSTPCYTNGSLVGFGQPNRPATNGYHSNGTKPKNGTKKPQKHRRPVDQRLTPLTNPGLDVTVLETPQITIDDDSDDVKIISEVSRRKSQDDFANVRPGRRFTVPILSPVSPIECITVESNGVSRSGGKDSALLTPREGSVSGSRGYTAHQVVKLQEKEQYKLLLEKMIKKQVYRPLKKDAAPVEVDLTKETEEIAWSRPYKKELLKKPLTEFMEKRYTPMKLVTKPRASVDIVSVSSTQSDDEVQVEKSLPSFRNARETMKESLKNKKADFTSQEWVNELKRALRQETEQYMQVVKAQEDKMKRFRDRRDAKAEEERLLFEKFKIPADVFDEKGSDEFPALTPEMEAEVASVLRTNGTHAFNNEFITKYDDVNLLRKEFQTLNDETWLLDEVLNSYMKLLVERSKLDNYPSVYAFSTFFFASVQSRGPKSVMRWTRKVDIFSFDLLLVPIHCSGVHWSLCVVDNRTKTIRYYDSMGGGGSGGSVTQRVLDYLIEEMKNKKNIDMSKEEYSREIVTGLPLQGNGSDCGMFTLKYAEYVCRDARITFKQENIPYFRRRMAWELLNHTLM